MLLGDHSPVSGLGGVSSRATVRPHMVMVATSTVLLSKVLLIRCKVVVVLRHVQARYHLETVGSLDEA